MNSIALFLLLCIPARLLIAWGSAKVPSRYVMLYALALLAISIGFLYLYFTKGRQMAPEAGGATWWANYRLIIGLLYLASAIYLFQGRQDLAWIPLLIDVIFGLIIFVNKHYKCFS
jgi:hypothetical protein